MSEEPVEAQLKKVEEGIRVLKETVAGLVDGLAGLVERLKNATVGLQKEMEEEGGSEEEK